MGQFAEDIQNVAFLARRAAADQAGIISGDNPARFNTSDPLRLWVIQVSIIIIFTQLLSLVLGRLRQPRVIAEVIGGVLLGPSVFGRIPRFTKSIFPSQSLPFLSLTATLGLVFFLFIVGLEVDLGSFRRNARSAAAISAAGLIIPLGLGATIAIPIYHTFVSSTVNFGYFVLFVAVAVGITAFPVLCRILTELRLLDTPVGSTVLAAGVANDVVGWILLALTVALANAKTGLTALWVLLTAVGYVLFLIFPVKWAFRWLARKTGSLESGQPSTFMMTVTFLLVLVSAFFTDVIGIHAIFGGFVAGLIIPHEGGFAIALVEKLEDLISLIFLPIYFALSGLSTNLGLLNTGKTWGYVILLCVVSFLSKFLGCFATARLTGFNWRESGAIGTLMSCKGLVELIVLNVGLQAGVLDTRTFSMFVLHALLLTIATTPLTLLWYPESARTYFKHEKEELTKTESTVDKASTISGAIPAPQPPTGTNLAVVLNRVDQLPAMMTLTQLLQRPSVATVAPNQHQGMIDPSRALAPVKLSALRLVELTERTSAVLRSQENAALASADSLLSVLRACGRLNRVSVTGTLAVIPEDEFAQYVASFVRDRMANMVVLPWTLATSVGGANLEDHAGSGGLTPSAVGSYNPFENLFSPSGPPPSSGSLVYSTFIRRVFSDTSMNVALFIDRPANVDATGLTGEGYHLYLPFFGGPDDRFALELVVQLCANPAVHATVVRIRASSAVDAEGPTEAMVGHSLEQMDTIQREKAAVITTYSASTPRYDTTYATHDPQSTMACLASNATDTVLWERYSVQTRDQAEANNGLQEHVRAALSRITFIDVEPTPLPLHTAVDHASPTQLRIANPSFGATAGTLVVIAGRGRHYSMHKASSRTGVAVPLGAGAGAGAAAGIGTSSHTPSSSSADAALRAELRTLLIAASGGASAGGLVGTTSSGAGSGSELRRVVGTVATAFLAVTAMNHANSVLVVQAEAAAGLAEEV